MLNQIPSNDTFKNIVEEYLLPFFAGSEVRGFCSVPKRNKNQLVTQLNRKSASDLQLMPSGNADYCLHIFRSQPFDDEEKKLVKSFLKAASRLYGVKNKLHQDDLAVSVLTETVARFVSAQDHDFLYSLLFRLGQWSQHTYEGQRIAFSVGIEPSDTTAPDIVTFDDLLDQDFLKVLSNGYDTLLVFDKKGVLQWHKCCRSSDEDMALFAPLRFMPIAAWTKSNERVAIVLNRNGEILVFKNGRILFAKRRGHWRFFAHEPVIKQFTKNGIARNSDINFRKELYLTCLDIAFSRTGGCIGILTKKHEKKGKSLVNQGDKLEVDSFDPAKRRAIKRIVGRKKFQELDRFVRLELLSMDGATVLDYQGNILAVGAILRIEDRSTTGGGRQSAAEALADFGLGIKISNDGYIRVISRGRKKICEVG